MRTNMVGGMALRIIAVSLAVFTCSIQAQHCETFDMQFVDGKVFGVPWLPAVQQRFKITIDANEVIIYLSNVARADIAKNDEYYKIVLDGTMTGFGGGSDGSTISLGEGVVRENRQASGINILTSGTEEEIFIEATTSETSGFQRLAVYDGAENEIIAWTNTNPSITVDIRYVGFQVYGPDATLQLCDVLPILRSEDQPASQSSTDQSYEAGLAVDGQALTDLADNSCSLTENNLESWWMVDLGEEYDIKMVILHNRLDANSDVLLGAKVLVGSCPAANRNDNKQCDGLVNDDDLLDGIPILRSCAENTYGQYVFVEGTERTLALCEVKVYGEIILEENRPTLLLQLPSYTYSEAQTAITVSVQHIATYPTCSSIDISATDGTATDADYALQDTSVFFGPDDEFQEVRLQVTDDLLAESSEDFTVNLVTSSVIGAWTGTRDATDVTIQDDDTVTYRFSKDTYRVSESDGVVEIEVLRVGGITNPGDIALTLTLGSALPVADYDITRIELHYDPDEDKKTGEIVIVDDKQLENIEEFYVAIQILNDFGEVDPDLDKATVVIDDNDYEFYFEVTAIDVVEKEGEVEIEAKRQGSLELQSGIELVIYPDTASHSTDYSSINIIPLIFEPGENSVTHRIQLLDDQFGEPDEQFAVTLRTDAGEIIDGKERITITIKDDDARYYLESEFATVSELDMTVTITVLRTEYTDVQSTARISTSFITAQNSDFTSVLYYPVTFNIGDSRQTFTITIQDDTEAESLESFRVFIDDADGFIGTPSQAIVTIVDNDGKVTFDSTSYLVSERDNQILIDVSRTGALDNTASVRLLSSTASALNQDYISIDETLIFPVNVASLTIPVTILQDIHEEDDETFTLLLTSAVNATIGNINQATVIIVDGLTTDVPLKESDTGLSTGVIIGISVAAGAVVLILIGVSIAVFYFRMRTDPKSGSQFQSQQLDQKLGSQFQSQQLDPAYPFAAQNALAFSNRQDVGYWSNMYNGFNRQETPIDSVQQMMGGLDMPATYREYTDGSIYAGPRLMYR